MEHTYLSFSIGSQTYAIPVEKVLEVLDMKKITYVPGAHEDILGVMNFRGDFLAVYNGRKKINKQETELVSSYVLIVLDLSQHGNNHRIALKADRVNEVTNISPNDIQELPAMNKQKMPEFFSGIYNQSGTFVFLLNTSMAFC